MEFDIFFLKKKKNRMDFHIYFSEILQLSRYARVIA